jgi:uncharacterized protein (DUF1697 family)
MAERVAALLRGINVGGHRPLPMPALREALAAAGYTGVQTYVQSGNVVFDTDAPPEQVARDLSALIEREFDLDVPVVVRTRDELAAVVADNPLGDVADVPKLQHVLFLAEPLPPAAAEEVGKLAVEPERLVAREREIHAWYPGGMQKSKLARALAGKTLGVATDRNWTTVLKLLEMCGG